MILSDSSLAEHASKIEQSIDQAAREVSPEQFKSIIGDPGRSVLRSTMEAVGAHSASIWLADPDNEHLVVTHCDPESEFAGWRQPITEGLISLVFASEHCLCENNVYANAEHSKKVDEAFGHVTTAMIAAPFYLAGNLRGVISCVQFDGSEDPGSPSGFSARNMNRVRRLSTVLERLANYRLLTSYLSLEL